MWKHGSCISIIFLSFSLDGTILGTCDTHFGQPLGARLRRERQGLASLMGHSETDGMSNFSHFQLSKRQKSEFFQGLVHFFRLSG